MCDTFSELSKNIAQNFIQTILFVDDKAYNPIQNDHPFDVKQMIKESAGRGIIATAYAPEIQEDLDQIVEVGKKADVIVLDWRMNINDASGSEQDDDEEEDVSDHRGDFAISVIKNIIANTQADDLADQLKLIFIYTGEKVFREYVRLFMQSLAALNSLMISPFCVVELEFLYGQKKSCLQVLNICLKIKNDFAPIHSCLTRFQLNMPRYHLVC